MKARGKRFWLFYFQVFDKSINIKELRKLRHETIKET